MDQLLPRTRDRKKNDIETDRLDPWEDSQYGLPKLVPQNMTGGNRRCRADCEDETTY